MPLQYGGGAVRYGRLSSWAGPIPPAGQRVKNPPGLQPTLTVPEPEAHIASMTPAQTAGRWVRIAMAMAFGFMNLGHGPIMTFAHAGKHDIASVAAPPAHHGNDHHHHHPAGDDDGSAPAADRPAACNAFGCFITVGPAVVDDRRPVLLPIGKLVPPTAAEGSPDTPEPADPPPRLHG
jgi:hypothetical protein